jgi:V8-like Glu-specific endopeptidase
MRKSFIGIVTVGFLSWGAVEQAAAQQNISATQASVAQQGSLTVLTMPSTQAQMMDVGVDFTHAQPLPLPGAPSSLAVTAQADMINALTSQAAVSEPGHAPGRKGNGKSQPLELGAPEAAASSGVTPQEFGTGNEPFNTARADLSPTATNKTYPYRASGKLFFTIPGDTRTWMCSASLIKRGVVVTAAHCVANFGQSQFYTNWQFVPGYRNGKAPYGTWTVQTAWVPTAYYNGTDACAVAGVVCQDDVAVLVLTASATGKYPGTSTGWYGYGWNGYGFTGGLTQITQLGYPVCLDNGFYMERNDSYGFTSSGNSNNTLIGSLMCGGSSGGPWLVNLGLRPSLTGTSAGTAPDPNVVVGVTSWGYTSTSPKQQGASPFTSNNIVPLVNSACTGVPAACS